MDNTTAPVTAELYDSAPDYVTYVKTIRAHGDLIERLRKSAEISDEDRKTFESLVKLKGGRIHISVLTDDRCSDSANNLPIVETVVRAVPAMDMRIFRMKEYTDLNDWYNGHGIDHIPVLTFFDAQWNQIGHWVERPVSATERLNLWKAEKRPEIDRLESSGTLEDKRRLRQLYRGVAEEMASWYLGGLWKDTIAEIQTVLRG